MRDLPARSQLHMVSQGASFRFESAVETLVDLDGETVGRLPLEVSVLPRAFSVGAA